MVRLEGCLTLVQVIEQLNGHWRTGRIRRRDVDADAIEIIIEILRDVIRYLEPESEEAN